MVNGNPLKSNKVQPPCQTPRYAANDDIPIPRNGGNGYSEDMRRHTVVRYEEIGKNINNIETLPHASTAKRYNKRITELGRNVRMRHTGNKLKEGIRGYPLFLLATYRKIYPKATRYECIAFLWRSYSRYLPVPRVYSLKDITEAENAIGINRKKGSTTANQAFTFRNRYKRYRYWTMNYPNGIADIRRDDMIDVDEAGIKLEHANRRMGKAALSGRVRQRGNYGHGENHTLKMAISGDPEGRCWVRFDTAGTDAISFAAFIESILELLPPGTPGNRKCFIMDNLLAHHNPLTLNAILAAGHRFVFRAPYYPVDGPIEYVFNTIEMALSYKMYDISSPAELRQQLFAIIRGIPEFVNYFANVGYTN